MFQSGQSLKHIVVRPVACFCWKYRFILITSIPFPYFFPYRVYVISMLFQLLTLNLEFLYCGLLPYLVVKRFVSFLLQKCRLFFTHSMITNCFCLWSKWLSFIIWVCISCQKIHCHKRDPSYTSKIYFKLILEKVLMERKRSDVLFNFIFCYHKENYAAMIRSELAHFSFFGGGGCCWKYNISWRPYIVSCIQIRFPWYMYFDYQLCLSYSEDQNTTLKYADLE